MDLNKILRQLRIENGLTQKELAKILKTSDKNIWNYEKGLASPPYEVLVAYAKYFEISTDFILGQEDDFGTPTVATMGDVLTSEERELINLFRGLSPFLKGLTLDTVRGWSGNSDNGSLHKKA